MKAFAKHVLLGLLALALTLSLVACGGDPVGTTTTADSTTTSVDDVVTTTDANNGETNDGEQTTTDSSASQDPTATGSTTTVPGVTTTTTTTIATTTTTGGQTPSGELTWADMKANMPAKLNGTTITMFNWNAADSITDAEKVIASFTKETGIKVDWQVGSYGTYGTQIAAKQAAKEAPDIIRMKEVNPAIMTMLQPLSNSGFSFADSAWDSELMDVYSYNGKAYATNMKNTLMQQPDVLMYNKNLIDKYDLEDPYTLWKQGKWDWDKFVAMCIEFADAAETGSFAFSYNQALTGAHLLGVDLVTYQDGKYVSHMTDKKLQQGIKMYIKLVKEKLLSNIFAKDLFEGGKVLFHQDGTIGARKTHFYYVSLKNSNKLGVVPMPTIKGETNYQVYRELEAYAIPSGAKNAEAVPYFLRYFLDSANYNEKNFFANASVLDVYKHCLSQKNRIASYTSKTVLTEETGGHLLAESLIQASEGQVNSILSENRYKVEAAVKQANTMMEKLK